MNLFKREWQAAGKAIIIWCIGLSLLIVLTFYKMQSLGSVEGGIQTMLESLPASLRVFFANAAFNPHNAIDMYGTLHFYLTMALSFHAILLGSSILFKEQRDQTCEFLYLKGYKRSTIYFNKIMAGVSQLLFINLICFAIVFFTLYGSGTSFQIIDFFGFSSCLWLSQCLLMFIGILFSLCLNAKGAMGSCVFLSVMLAIHIYAMMKGETVIDNVSIFHWLDGNLLAKVDVATPHVWIMGILIIILAWIGGYMHEHKDM